MHRTAYRFVASLALSAAALPATVAAQTPSRVKFTVDRPHSAVEFAVRFMGLSTVRGEFADWGGTLMLDEKDPTKSTISIVIRTASINTNTQVRDTHLKSPDFFDAEKYPSIHFRSERIERAKDGYIVRGPLTMRGITKEVAIPMKMLHPARPDAWGNSRIGFVGETKVNRKDYGIQGTAFWNSEFDPGRMAIGDDVTISLMISGVIPNTDRWTTPRGDSILTMLTTQGAEKTVAHYRTDLAAREPAMRDGMLAAAMGKLLDKDRYADAVAIGTLWTELSPANSNAFSSLGEAHALAGEKPKAREKFQKAVELDKENTDAVEWLRSMD
ncbi:MAG TPA: YceI family protein [Gemmatimonadaceae bacterium]|nr:YceI family protein [Gemmatimonadaceae bacterium]